MLIDSHNHADLVCDNEFWTTLKVNAVTCIVWAYCVDRPATAKEYKENLEAQKANLITSSDSAVPCYFCRGIHPRCIPLAWEKCPDLICQELSPLLDCWRSMPEFVGIGEIGLESGSELEQEVFVAQASYAKLCNLPIGVHTPRSNKEPMLDLTLELLNEVQVNPSMVVIDHLTSSQLVQRVINKGYFAGVTVSKYKSSPEEAIDIVRSCEHSMQRIMLNTDAIEADVEEYNHFLKVRELLDAEQSAQVLNNTARHFFALELAVAG